MKKIIKIKESELKEVINKILNEQQNYDVIDTFDKKRIEVKETAKHLLKTIIEMENEYESNPVLKNSYTIYFDEMIQTGRKFFKSVKYNFDDNDNEFSNKE